VEVQQQREYTVTWRFISLKVLNEHVDAEWYTPERKASHLRGTFGLRVANALRSERPERVGDLYTALGQALHRDQRGAELSADPVGFMVGVLETLGLPTSLAEAALDESHDATLRAETELALSRTGKDVGTPILTFHPGAANEASFFGPVIASIPRGDEAVKLWDAVEVIATSSGMAELKRSNRGSINFD
jgi:hypothetical protein